MIVKLHPFQLSKIINGLIWIACGGALIALRGPFFFQNSYVLLWELIGGAMIAYGAGRVVLALARGAPTSSRLNETADSHSF